MTSEKAAAKASRGPYKNGVKRRQQIVKAAASMFGRYGYQGASLRAIAERVGTTPATLIAYFTNKEGLLVAVLEYWRKESDPTTSLYGGLDHFRAFLQLMRYHEQHRGLIELFLTMSVEASDEAHPAHDFIVERQRQTLEDMIRNFAAAVESGQIRPMRPEAIETEARLLIATLDGIELQWILDRSVDLEATVRTFVDASIARWSGRPLAVVATETDAWLTEHDQQPGRAEPHPASSHKKRG